MKEFNLYNIWVCEKIKQTGRHKNRKNVLCVSYNFTKGRVVMPAVYAHYKFGKEVYRSLPSDIRQIIKENRPAFLLGLHGPDLLFYYRAYAKNRVNRLGVKMHREPAADFFERGRSVYRQRPNYVLLSYLCGFLCHFMLDSECHPYISRYMKEHRLGHLEIETDFDRDLLRKDGHDPVTHNCTRHLMRDLDTEEAIASVLDGVTADEVDESIVGFHKVIRLFQCKSAGKARAMTAFFTLLGQKKGLAGLIMTDEPDPKCAESRKALKERMDWAVKPAAEEIVNYVRAIQGEDPLSVRLNRDFE